jgi:protease PrsW
MISLLSFILSVATAFLGLYLVYRRYRLNHDRQKLIRKTGLYGFLAVILAGIAEIILIELISPAASVLDIIIRAFLISALIEETVKYLAFRAAVFPSPIFSTVREGIFYGLGVGLGFSILENALYWLFQPSLTFLRGITSVPLHGGTAILMAFFASKSACKGKPVTLRGILLAVLFHGVYNFLILAGTPWKFLSAGVLVILAAYCVFLFRKS